MPTCDICSKQIERYEMTTISGPTVVSATRRGFIPRNQGAHGAMGSLAGLFGMSTPKEDLWKSTVSQNMNVDWGLCSSCASELNSY